MISYRPVLHILPAVEAGLLLFVANRTILAWGEHGKSWESPKLSDEGISVTAVEGCTLRGLGWSMFTDKETEFTLDLRSGLLIGS